MDNGEFVNIEIDYKKSWEMFKNYLFIMELRSPDIGLVKTMESIEVLNTTSNCIKITQ